MREGSLLPFLKKQRVSIYYSFLVIGRFTPPVFQTLILTRHKIASCHRFFILWFSAGGFLHFTARFFSKVLTECFFTQYVHHIPSSNKPYP